MWPYCCPFLMVPRPGFDPAALRLGNEHLGTWYGHEDRLIGFAVVIRGLPPWMTWGGRQRHGLRGLKLVPSGWYPRRLRSPDL
jgi:hypothetical protein